MSRLKGADLGVSVPAGTPNYRGDWLSANTYAANDMVRDNGLLWLALNAVPSGSGYEPKLAPTYVPGASVVGAATVAGASAAAINSVAMPFTTTAAPQTVGGVTVTFGSAPGATSIRVGIATALGANDGAITWLGATPAAVTAPTSAGTFSYDLPVPVSLSASTTYYAVVQVVAGGNSNLNWGASSTVVSGCIASTGTLQRTTAIGGAWGGNTFNMPFSIYSGSLPYWQPAAAAIETVNTVSASGAAVTLLDVPAATMHRVTLTANTTITLPFPGAGKSFTVELVQDATGGRTVAWATPSGAIRWPGGTAPTITATANAIDVVSFICIGGTNWYGFIAGQAFA